jgi:uncharacterized membrane protein YdbT with pleckstrin-like domain
MSIRPNGYLAQVLGSDEQVLLITRPHWLVLLAKILLWTVLVLIVVTGAAWLRVAGSHLWAWVTPLALVPLGFWVWEYQVWFNQMNVITDHRVIQMEGVLNKQVSDSILDKLNDVKTEQSLLGRIFGYGNIEILTASDEGTNVLHMIQDPLGFKRAMLNAKAAMEDARHSPAD